MVTFGQLLLVILFLFGAFYIYCKRKFNYWKDKGVPHRPPSVPFGNLLDLIFNDDSVSKFFAKLYNEFESPYIGFYALTKPFLLVKDPNLIKIILIKEFNIFQNRCFFFNKKIDPVMSNSLLGIKGPDWRILRKKISPAFSSGKMKIMEPLMDECGLNMKEYLEKNLDKSLEMKEVAAKYTTNVIMSCAFGLNSNCFEKDAILRDYGKTIFPTTPIGLFKSLTYLFAPIFVRIFKHTFIDRTATVFFRNVFEDTLRQRQLNNVNRGDLIDTLNKIKNEETSDDTFKFDDDVVFAQAIIFFGAGQEAASSTIAYTLHELALNFEIQDKLRLEVFREIEKYNGVTYEAIQNMKYLDMIISETLRKYPLTPLITRESIESYKLPTGLLLDKGTSILISQMAMHHNPEYFPNPKKYDPERFSDENKGKIPNYVYLPFGDGPRNCIGERFGLLSSKLGVVHVVKNFKIETNSNTCEPVIYERTPLLQAKYGINLTCRKL
ncbi:hypothetical protein FQR65_LT11530 [Abscondita terminalis]|nr:hypothetical protein FQR65_LT11530 [Abscondita terminalis]